MRFALSFFLLLGSAAASPFSNLYFFGDSLSDSGNVFSLTAGFYPPAPYSGGGMSNGRIWTDIFATLKGLPNAGKPAGMTLGPNYLNLTVPGTGNNYAIAGARNDTTGTLDSLGIPSGVRTQVNYYLSKQTVDPNALYVLFGGGNDIRDASLLDPTARDAAATTAAFNMTIGAYLLAEAGARRFLVMNAPDVGLTPEAKIERKNSASATAASVQYNFALDYFLNSLSYEGLEMFRFDTFGLFNLIYQDVLSGGLQTGLTNATLPCFSGFSGSTGADCSKSIFSDNIHPTAQMHAILGYSVHNVVHNPEPATVAMVAITLGLIVWRLRRSRQQVFGRRP